MPRGTAQIEVTLDIDVNGILNVTACEKSKGTIKNISITSNRDRSKEELDRLINVSEELKDQDSKAKELIEARNQLEQLCYSVRTTLGDEKIKHKFKEGEKEQVEKVVNDALAWMNNNPNASKGEYDSKVKEIEAVFHPIMTRQGEGEGIGETNEHSNRHGSTRVDETVD